MTRSIGVGRGGKRPNAGPKRTPYLYETQLFAARLGDRRLMDAADALYAEAERDGHLFVPIPRPQLQLRPPVSGQERLGDSHDPPQHRADSGNSRSAMLM